MEHNGRRLRRRDIHDAPSIADLTLLTTRGRNPAEATGNATVKARSLRDGAQFVLG